MNAGNGPGRNSISPEELERERVRTYVAWSRATLPVWYWPVLAVGLSGWLIGMGFGAVYGAGGALLVMLVSFGGVQFVERQTGVRMPRFRGMPRPLRLAYLPALGAGIWLVAALPAVAVSDEPMIALGAVSGPVVALGAAMSSWCYRRAADALADEAGIAR